MNALTIGIRVFSIASMALSGAWAAVQLRAKLQERESANSEWVGMTEEEWDAQCEKVEQELELERAEEDEERDIAYDEARFAKELAEDIQKREQELAQEKILDAWAEESIFVYDGEEREQELDFNRQALARLQEDIAQLNEERRNLQERIYFLYNSDAHNNGMPIEEIDCEWDEFDDMSETWEEKKKEKELHQELEQKERVWARLEEEAKSAKDIVWAEIADQDIHTSGGK